MQAEIINAQVSVSGQLSAQDVAALAADGVKIIVCNRPDNEDYGQPSFAAIAAEAAKHGVEAVLIAFSGGEMGQSHVDAFLPYLSTGKRLHAYCRSGRRSRSLWEEADAQRDY